MLQGKHNRRRFLNKAFRLAIGSSLALLLPGSGAKASPERQTPQRPEAWIDCHAHLQPLYPVHGVGLSFDWTGAVAVALSRMDQAGISHTVIMPPPMMPGQDGTYDAAELRGVCAENKDRFIFMAGGGSLNPMIHQAWRQGSVEPSMERRFRDTAKQILAMGAAGFGEMAAEHFSFTTNHPY